MTDITLIIIDICVIIIYSLHLYLNIQKLPEWKENIEIIIDGTKED